MLNVNYSRVICLDQNSFFPLINNFLSLFSPFFPTLLVLSHLVNSSFSILCVSSLNLQLVLKCNYASVFILPCHPPASQLLPLFPSCLPQFLPFPFPPAASGAPQWDLFLFFCAVFSSHTWMIHFFCSHLALSVPSVAVLKGSWGILPAPKVTVLTCRIPLLPCGIFLLTPPRVLPNIICNNQPSPNF